MENCARAQYSGETMTEANKSLLSEVCKSRASFSRGREIIYKLALGLVQGWIPACAGTTKLVLHTSSR